MLHAVLTHSTNWTTIAASHVSERSTLALKNRYPTPRLRHENGTQSNENTAEETTRASGCEGAPEKSRDETRTTQKVQGCLAKRVAEADIKFEEDEDEDGEEYNVDGDVCHAHFMANFNKPRMRTVSGHAKDFLPPVLSTMG